MSALTDTKTGAAVSFKATKHERQLVAIAVERAVQAKLCTRANAINVEMSLVACNANGCRLDFAKLLSFNDFSFAHDVAGIDRHINHDTGALQDHFRPRCAARQGEGS